MKKWLLILLLMMVPVLGCAEEACPLCGTFGDSSLCTREPLVCAL